MEWKFKGKNVGVVELTKERARHIIGFYPDVKPYFSNIAEVLNSP